MLALTQTWIPPRSNGSEQQRTTVNINVCCSLEFVDALRGERILLRRLICSWHMAAGQLAVLQGATRRQRFA
jgi:hypothetical protein